MQELIEKEKKKKNSKLSGRFNAVTNSNVPKSTTSNSNNLVLSD